MKKLLICAVVLMMVIAFTGWDSQAACYQIVMMGGQPTAWSLGTVNKGCSAATVNRLNSIVLYVCLPDTGCDTTVSIVRCENNSEEIGISFSPTPRITANGYYSSSLDESGSNNEYYLQFGDCLNPQGHP